MFKKWTIYSHLTSLDPLYKADFFTVSDSSDNYSNSSDSFFVCDIQEQAATNIPKTWFYADLCVHKC